MILYYALEHTWVIVYFIIYTLQKNWQAEEGHIVILLSCTPTGCSISNYIMLMLHKNYYSTRNCLIFQLMHRSISYGFSEIHKMCVLTSNNTNLHLIYTCWKKPSWVLNSNLSIVSLSSYHYHLIESD